VRIAPLANKRGGGWKLNNAMRISQLPQARVTVVVKQACALMALAVKSVVKVLCALVASVTQW